MVDAKLNILEGKVLPGDVARETMQLLAQYKVDAWVYAGTEWLIRDPQAPHVAREAATVKFEATVVTGFDDVLDKAVKIVGVSDDLDLLARCEQEAQKRLGDRATAARSPRRRSCGRSR